MNKIKSAESQRSLKNLLAEMLKITKMKANNIQVNKNKKQF